MKIDNKYINILEDILKYGYDYEDPNRKEVYRKELEYVVLRHLVSEGYPIITARKTYFKGAVGELLLFLKGSTDIRDYWQYGIRFWDQDYGKYNKISENAVNYYHSLWKSGKRYESSRWGMGKIYGHQYKKQYHVFDNFKENPLRTDLIVNSWQLEDLDDMCLKPCHYSYQLVGANDGFMIVYNMRSADFLLGQPINVQFYFLMGMLLELWSGHKFNGVVGSLCKVHLYDNQLKLADKMVNMSPELYKDGVEVVVEINPKLKELPFSEFIKHIEPENFKLINYDFVLDEKVPMLSYKK